MRLLKLLVGAAAIGLIAAAFRDFRSDRRLPPDLPTPPDRAEGTEEAEPVLGYDGMDRDTLLDWLDDAELDPATLLRIRAYEAANQNREPVLSALDDLLEE